MDHPGNARRREEKALPSTLTPAALRTTVATNCHGSHGSHGSRHPEAPMPKPRSRRLPDLNADLPDVLEPDPLPLEPGQGMVPAAIPDDPEHDRLVDPEDARQGRPLRQ